MTTRALALVLALGAAACSNDNSNPVGPSTVPPTSFTYATTFTARGAVTRTFEQVSRGAVNITLTTVSPDVPLGIGIGMPRQDGVCALTSATTATPSTSPQITVTADPGLWCVRVWDPGTVPELVAFSMSVTHN